MGLQLSPQAALLMVLAQGTSLPACSHPQEEEPRLPCSTSAGHAAPHSSREAATTSYTELIQHLLHHSTSRCQASAVWHQEHTLWQAPAHANHAELVPVLNTTAQEQGPHISGTILSIFQVIGPNQTLAVCPGSNSSRAKSCEFSNIQQCLVFAGPLKRQHKPRLTVTALCNVQSALCRSQQGRVVLEQHLPLN